MKKHLQKLAGAALILLLVPAGLTAGAAKSYTAGKKILQITPPGSKTLSAELSSMSGAGMSSAVIKEASSFTHVKQKHLSSPQLDTVTVILKPGQGAALLAWVQMAQKDKIRFNAKILAIDAQGKTRQTLELTKAFLTALDLPPDPNHGAKLELMPEVRKNTQP